MTQTGGLATVAWRPAPRALGRVMLDHRRNRGPIVSQRSAVPLSSHSVSSPQLLADCGVAGVHRLLASFDQLADADAIVVVAGMEGALASLVAGISPAPVVAVPTSAGYGAALEGVTALARHARVVRRGLDRRRDRQRVRCGCGGRAHARYDSA